MNAAKTILAYANVKKIDFSCIKSAITFFVIYDPFLSNS